MNLISRPHALTRSLAHTRSAPSLLIPDSPPFHPLNSRFPATSPHALPILPAEQLSPGPFQSPLDPLPSYILRLSSSPSRQQQALPSARPRRPGVSSPHLFHSSKPPCPRPRPPHRSLRSKHLGSDISRDSDAASSRRSARVRHESKSCMLPSPACCFPTHRLISSVNRNKLGEVSGIDESGLYTKSIELLHPDLDSSRLGRPRRAGL